MSYYLLPFVADNTQHHGIGRDDIPGDEVRQHLSDTGPPCYCLWGQGAHFACTVSFQTRGQGKNERGDGSQRPPVVDGFRVHAL